MSRAARLWTALALTAVMGLSAACVLPARWVMAWIPDDAPLTVVDAQGSLWAAQATLAVGVGPLRRSLPEPLHWRLDWAGGPVLVLSHAWLGGAVEIRPAWGGLRLSGQTLRMPATVLTAVHAVFNTLEPGGDLRLRWSDMLLGRDGPQVAAGQPLLDVQWRQASSALSRVRPLGDYRFSAQATARTDFVLQLQTVRGPLRAEGSGTWSPAGRLVFDGRTWPDADAPAHTQAALRRLLDILGP